MDPKKLKPQMKKKPKVPWLQQTMRSVGIATKEVFSDMTPSLSSTIKGVATSTKNLTDSMKNSKGKGSDALKNNSWVQLSQRTIERAINDLKTGKFKDEKREEDLSMKAIGFDDDFMKDMEDLGDLADDDVSFTYVDEGGSSGESAEAALYIGEAINAGTEATLNASKATVDAMVSISNTSFNAIQKLGSQMVEHLGNIDNTLSAILQYHEENTTKFYEATISMYEKFGAKSEEEEDYSKDKLTANDLFDNDKKFDVKKYLKLVQQQAKDSFTGSELGGTLSLLDNPEMIETMLANPIHSLTKLGINKLIPGMVKETMNGIETSFRDFVPSMLARLGNQSTQDREGLSAKLREIIGKVFGIDSSMDRNFELNDKVSKEAAVFDGVTRNAITEVLPKYARESTAYLKYIAEKMGAKKDLIADAEIYNASTNKYQTRQELREEIAAQIQESMSGAYRNTEFGSALAYGASTLNDKHAESYERLMTQLLTYMTQYKDNLSAKDMDVDNEESAINKILKEIGGNGESIQSKSVLRETLRKMYREDIGVSNVAASQVKARAQYQSLIKDMGKEYDAYNLGGAGIDEETDIYDLLDEVYGWKKREQNEERKKKKERRINRLSPGERIIDDLTDMRPASMIAEEGLSQMVVKDYNGDYQNILDENGHNVRRSRYEANGGLTSFANAGAHIRNSMSLAMRGADGTEVINEFSKIFTESMKGLWSSFKDSFIVPFKETLFGKKNDDGYLEGGVFQGIQNKAKDTWNAVKLRISGGSYVDSEGNVHTEESEDVKPAFKIVKDVMSGIGDNIHKKLFGDEDVDENGEKKGVVTGLVGQLKKGLVDWKNALFGTDDEDVEASIENMKKKAMDSIPEAAAGAIGGAAFGASAGGLLGTLIGGPVGGAILGMGLSFARKSDAFQRYVFGEEVEDEEGNKKKVGGLISDKVQKMFKDPKMKSALIGGAAIGLMKNVVLGSSGGLMGALVGGPLAGAVLGAGFGILKNSETFRTFLYGNEETGKTGIIQHIKNIWSKNNKNGEEGADAKDKGLIGRALLGAGGGALTAALIGKVGILGAALTPAGPIGGAILGMGVGIKLGSKKFREAIFGTKDEETGKRKGGLVGRLGNWMHTEVVGPVKTSLVDLGRYTKTQIKYSILEPLRISVEPIGKALVGGFKGIIDKGKELVGDVKKQVTEKVLKPVGKMVGAIFAPIRKIGEVVSKTAIKASLAVVTFPVKILKSVASYITSPFVRLGKTIKKYVTDPIKRKAKWLLKTIVGAPFRLIGKTLNFTAGLAVYGERKAKNAINNRRAKLGKALDKEWRDKGDFRSENRRLKHEKKQEIQRNRQKRRHDDAMDANRKQMARLLGYDAKYFTKENFEAAVTEAKRQKKRIVWQGDTKAKDFFEEDPQEEYKKKIRALNNDSLIDRDGKDDDVDTRQLTETTRIRTILNKLAEFFIGDDPLKAAKKKAREKVKEEEKEAKVEKKEERKDKFEKLADEWEQSGGLFKWSKGKVSGKFKEIKDYYKGEGQSFAEGGEVEANKPALVGDRGGDPRDAEIFVPRTSGKILSQSGDGIKTSIEGISDPTLIHIAEVISRKMRDISNEEEIGEEVTNVMGGVAGALNNLSSIFEGTKLGNWFGVGSNVAELIEGVGLGDKVNDGVNKVKSAFSRHNHAYAKGGTVEAGKPALVGDRGGDPRDAEIIVPEAKSRILSQKKDGIKVYIAGIASQAAKVIGSETGKEVSNKVAPEAKVGGFSKDAISGMVDNWDTFDEATKKAINRHMKKNGAVGINTKKEKAEAQAKRDTALAELKKKGSYETQQAAKIQREKENEQLNVLKDIESNTDDTKKTTKRSLLNWMKVFGKDGLITGGIILAWPLIQKLVLEVLPDVLPKIGTALGSIASFVGGIGKDLIDQLITASKRFGLNTEDGKSPVEVVTDTAKEIGDVVTNPTDPDKWKDLLLEDDGTTSHKTGSMINGARGIIKKVTKKPRNYLKYGETKPSGFRILKEKGKNLKTDFKTWKNASKANMSNATSNLKDAFKTTGKEAAEEVGEKVGKEAAEEVGEKVGKEVAQEGLEKGGNGLFKKVMGMIEEGFEKLLKKLMGKLGGKGAKEGTERGIRVAIKASLKKMEKLLLKKWPKVAPKIMAILGFAGAATSSVIGIPVMLVKEFGFSLIEGVNEMSNPRRLFKVGADTDVDWIMATIASAFGIFKGTTVGSIVDIVESIGEEAGIFFFQMTATAMYNAICRVFGQTDKIDSLGKNQKDLVDKYDKYVEKETEKEYKSYLLAHGLDEKEYTYDKFKEEKHTVNKKSEAEFNYEENKTLGAKMGDGILSLGKKFKNTAIGKGIFGEREEGYYDKESKLYYMKVEKDYYEIYEVSSVDKDGNPDKIKSTGNRIRKENMPDTKNMVKVKKGTNGTLDVIGDVVKSSFSAMKKMGGATVKTMKNTWSGFKKHGLKGAAVGLSAGIKNQWKTWKDNAKETSATLVSSASNTWLGKKFTNSKVGKGILSAGKGVWNFFTKKKDDKKEAEVKREVYWLNPDNSFYDASGKYYTANGYRLESKDVDKDTLEEMISSGSLVQKYDWKKTVDANRKAIEGALSTQNTATNKLNDVAKQSAEVTKNSTSLAQTELEKRQKYLKEHGIADPMTDYFTKVKANNNKGYFTPNGQGYYVRNTDGTFNRYTMAGDLVEEKIGGKAAEEIWKSINAGIYKEAEITDKKNINTSVTNMQNTLEKGWKDAEATVTDTNTNLGGSGFKYTLPKQTGGLGGFGEVVKAIKDLINSKTSQQAPKMKPAMVGGYGAVNDFPYFSQKDSRWANRDYSKGDSKANMEDGGCGPTAMAMVASKYKGSTTPVDMAEDAIRSGYRDETGTNAKFISHEANKLGIKSKRTNTPSAAEISRNVGNGKSMILNGITDGTTESPFTRSGHYVVAVGKDEDGNILINDPRGENYSASVDPNFLAEESRVGWEFGDNESSGGFGNPIRKIFGGFGKLKKPKIPKKSSTGKKWKNYSPGSGNTTDDQNYAKWKKWYDLKDLPKKSSTGKKWKDYSPGTGTTKDNQNYAIWAKYHKDKADAKNVSTKNTKGIWLQVVAATKKSFASTKPGYYTHNGNKYIDVTANGRTMKHVRTDCSGFVSCCLRMYTGSTTFNNQASSWYTMSNKSIANAGFTTMAFPGWDKLQAGDILCHPGHHVEVYAGSPGGKPHSYNAGSTDSCNNPGMTPSSKSHAYTHIWRPNAPGSADSSGIELYKEYGENGPLNTSGKTTTTSGGFTGVLGKISNIFSQFATKAMDGVLTGKWDYNFDTSDDVSGTTTSSGTDTTGSSSYTGSMDSSAAMRVFNDTWQYEMGKKGPGTIGAPLKDGAGKNYGAPSLTERWNLKDFTYWIKNHYPKIGNKLKGTPASSTFDESWKALGKSNEQEFLQSQINYTFEKKLKPALSIIKDKSGVDLNNGKYTEGMFSILLSMANQRPAWSTEKWVPYLNSHKNASSADIINGVGGDIAKNYSGNYSTSIRNRYTKQVAHSLSMNTPFKYGSNIFTDTSLSGSETEESSKKKDKTKKDKDKKKKDTKGKTKNKNKKGGKGGFGDFEIGGFGDESSNVLESLDKEIENLTTDVPEAKINTEAGGFGVFEDYLKGIGRHPKHLKKVLGATYINLRKQFKKKLKDQEKLVTDAIKAYHKKKKKKTTKEVVRKLAVIKPKKTTKKKKEEAYTKPTRLDTIDIDRVHDLDDFQLAMLKGLNEPDDPTVASTTSVNVVQNMHDMIDAYKNGGLGGFGAFEGYLRGIGRKPKHLKKVLGATYINLKKQFKKKLKEEEELVTAAIKAYHKKKKKKTTKEVVRNFVIPKTKKKAPSKKTEDVSIVKGKQREIDPSKVVSLHTLYNEPDDPTVASTTSVNVVQNMHDMIDAYKNGGLGGFGEFEDYILEEGFTPEEFKKGVETIQSTPTKLTKVSNTQTAKVRKPNKQLLNGIDFRGGKDSERKVSTDTNFFKETTTPIKAESNSLIKEIPVVNQMRKMMNDYKNKSTTQTTDTSGIESLLGEVRDLLTSIANGTTQIVSGVNSIGSKAGTVFNQTNNTITTSGNTSQKETNRINTKTSKNAQLAEQLARG